MIITDERESISGIEQRRAVAKWLAWVVTGGSLAVVAYGLSFTGVLRQTIWSPPGLLLFLLLAACYAAVTVAGYLVARRWFSAIVAIGSVFFAVVSIGVAPLVSVAAFLVACQILGELLFKTSPQDSGLLPAALRMTAGMAVYFCLTGLLVHFPINYPICYWGLVALPLLARWRSIPRILSTWARLLETPSNPRAYVAHALLGFCLLAHFLVALEPEAGYDALAMHLYAAGFVAGQHYWTFDTNHVIWALMPMAGDWGYTILYIFAGEFGARLLNYAAMLLLIVILVAAGRARLSVTLSLVLGACLASSPVVQLVTGSLFIDNFLALWTLAGLVAAVDFFIARRWSSFFLCAVVLGCSLHTKLGAVPGALVLGGLCIGIAIATLWRSPLKLAVAVMAWIVVFSVTGLPPYVTAYVQKHNPVYPFLAHTLGGAPSPVGDVVNTLYREPLRWTSLYDLTFHSDRFLESQNGSFGLHYLILIPLAITGLIFVRSKSNVVALFTATAIFITVYLSQAYIRYLYPALPIFIYAAAEPLAWLQSNARRLTLVLSVVFAVLAIVNLYLLPSSGWLHKQPFLPDVAGQFYRQAYLRAFAPARKLNDYLNLTANGDPVAYLGTYQIGGLQARAYTLSWHHARFVEEINASTNAMEVARVMKNYGILHTVNAKNLSSLPPRLQDYLRRYTHPVFASGDWEVRDLKIEVQVADEVLRNGEFDRGVAEWSVSGHVKSAAGTVEVTNHDILSQSFSARSGERFRLLLTASCPAPDTILRLQVNWADAAGRMAGVSLMPKPCGAGRTTYESLIQAPWNAAAVVVIVSANSNNRVIVDSVSLQR